MSTRRSLFSFLATLPVIGLLAPKAQASTDPRRVLEAARVRLENQTRTDLPQSLREQALALFQDGLDRCLAEMVHQRELLGDRRLDRLSLNINFEYEDGVQVANAPSIKLR